MKGSYEIRVQNRFVQYKFTLDRNITVIRGDSATGKTTLIDMIREYSEQGEQSAVSVSCAKKCVVLDGAGWKERLQYTHDSIVFVDEGNHFVTTHEFAECIEGTDNYYVIAVRDRLVQLPYSVNAVYGIHKKGRFGKLKRTYNEFYLLYGEEQEPARALRPETVLTEDSHSGYQFFKAVCDRNEIACTFADGNSNVYKALKNQLESTPSGKILVVADGAAFGAEMERVLQLKQEFPHRVFLCLPESFEWMILKADFLQDNEVREILAKPSDFIACENYFSWERYFTDILTKKTEGSYRRYTKTKLAAYYLRDDVADRILSVLKRVEL
jgi:hypothetical protein